MRLFHISFQGKLEQTLSILDCADRLMHAIIALTTHDPDLPAEGSPDSISKILK